MTEEIWRPVVGFEGAYSVSSEGRVRSEARSVPQSDSKGRSYARRVRERILKLTSDRKGYLKFNPFAGGAVSDRWVGPEVLKAFVGPAPEGQECCHNDGVNVNNRATNLRWDTRSGNHADKVLHGTDNRGEKHPFARLTEAIVRRVRTEDHRFAYVIAAELGVSAGAIVGARRGKSWKHI